MSQDRIEQVGSADDIFDNPATPFVVDFIGDSSALPVVVEKGSVSLDDRVLSIDAKGHADGPATLSFRPNHVRLAEAGAGTIGGAVSGSRRHGDIRRLELEVGLARHAARSTCRPPPIWRKTAVWRSNRSNGGFSRARPSSGAAGLRVPFLRPYQAASGLVPHA